MSTRDSVAARDARDRVITMFMAGVALVVVGLIGAAIGWPHMVVDDGELVQKGSSAVTVFSLGLVLVGFLPALFAVVAWAVRSGMETADRRPRGVTPWFRVARSSASGPRRTGGSPTGTS